MESTAVMMATHRIDMLVAMEPGKGDKPRMKALRGVASRKMEKIIAKTRGGNTSCGGVVVWLSRAWSALDVTVTHCRIKGAEDRLLALEFNNHKRGEHNKTLIISFYGINSAHTDTQMANAMLDWVETTKNEFRRRKPLRGGHNSG